MRAIHLLLFSAALAGALGCASVSGSNVSSKASPTGSAQGGTLAKLYYWRARPGKFDEYSRYVRDVAEPIDREAQRVGAFLSVSTLVARDAASPWTHMRVFVLRDSAQLAALSGALDAAGIRLEPDSVKRRIRGEYSATLRDRVGDATVELLR